MIDPFVHNVTHTTTVCGVVDFWRELHFLANEVHLREERRGSVCVCVC